MPRKLTRQTRDKISRSLQKHQEGVRVAKRREQAVLARQAREALSPQDRKSLKREKRLHKIYGITPGQFVTLSGYQGGRCGICCEDFGRDCSAMVDCDPETGLVRGLLCRSCLGCLNKLTRGSDFLVRVTEYLLNPPAHAGWASSSYDHETGAVLTNEQVLGIKEKQK